MSIELKTANAELAIVQEGDYIRIELPASGIDPIGAIKPAIRDNLGIGPTLRFDTGVDSIAGAGSSIPDKTDRSKNVLVIIGWGATTNSGDVKWDLLYKWGGIGTAIDGAEDNTLSVIQEVDTVTTTGYSITLFSIPAPSLTDRVLAIQLQRNGTNIVDTCTGNVHLAGVSFNFMVGV